MSLPRRWRSWSVSPGEPSIAGPAVNATPGGSPGTMLTSGLPGGIFAACCLSAKEEALCPGPLLSGGVSGALRGSG